MAEQVFAVSPKSMIVCQCVAVKALRGMLYGSRLVPVAFVSKLLKFCVCNSSSRLSGALPFDVGCQVSGSDSLSFLRWLVVARGMRAPHIDAHSSTKHEENIKRPLTLASSACPLQGSTTTQEPPLGSPSGPTIHFVHTHIHKHSMSGRNFNVAHFIPPAFIGMLPISCQPLWRPTQKGTLLEFYLFLFLPLSNHRDSDEKWHLRYGSLRLSLASSWPGVSCSLWACSPADHARPLRAGF